jgi:hypothetical protein
MLTVARGKKKPFTIQPLIEEPTRDWDDEIASATTLDELRALHSIANLENAGTNILDRIKTAAQAMS